MSDAAWEKLHNGSTYKVYRDPDHWWSLFRYTVAKPDGGVLTCTVTLAGARWAIRRHIRKGPQSKWWERPLADEVNPTGGR